jgi:NAD(P)-dependent dehydrogenase (short-subunit alcohol dehydrogenase family)
LCLNVAERKGRVVVADVDLAGAEETASQVANAGGEAAVIRCDVTRPEDVEAAARLADERFGGFDLMVNNAGVAVSGPVGDVPIEDWHWIVNVNLLGVVHGCHVAARRFRSERSGAVLNVASAAGLISTVDLGPYNATKAAVVALSETMHQELAPFGVSVTVLCPTFFQTRIVQNARSHGDPAGTDVVTRLMERSRLQAKDVARLAIDGCARGELFVVPMSDGRWMWRAKRLAPSFFYRALSPRVSSFLKQKLGATS